MHWPCCVTMQGLGEALKAERVGMDGAAAVGPVAHTESGNEWKAGIRNNRHFWFILHFLLSIGCENRCLAQSPALTRA